MVLSLRSKWTAGPGMLPERSSTQRFRQLGQKEPVSKDLVSIASNPRPRGILGSFQRKHSPGKT